LFLYLLIVLKSNKGEKIMRTTLLLFLVFLGIDLNAQWVSQTLGWTWESVRSLYFLNATQGYAGGDYGALKKTTDGGTTWTTVNPGCLNIINGIYFFDNTNGVICTNAAEIKKTIDGGSTWTVKYTQSNIQLQKLSFVNSTTGVAVGGEGGICSVLKSTNAGNTWTASTVTGYGGWLWDLDFPTTTTGYAVGIAGGIIKTTDGGSTWSTQTAVTSVWLRGVDFIDANTGYAVGDGGVILKTTDGGTTWTTQTSGTTANLEDVKFLTANTGYAVGHNSNDAIILKTVNGGTTWTVNFSTTFYGLLSIDIPTNNIAYAGGLTGTVFKNSNLSSIDETSLGSLQTSFYPNPCDEKATLVIDYENRIPDLKLRIFDITGKEIIRTEKINTTETNISMIKVSPGFYYYSVEDGKEVLSMGKIVKN
jgi:photosystem II stability/assembly factor-like uncharacterized protein